MITYVSAGLLALLTLSIPVGIVLFLLGFMAFGPDAGEGWERWINLLWFGWVIWFFQPPLQRQSSE